MFIIECAVRGSAEMSQIHTQWSYFSTVVGYCGFDDISLVKEWSVDHIIIVIFTCYQELWCGATACSWSICIFKNTYKTHISTYKTQ